MLPFYIESFHDCRSQYTLEEEYDDDNVDEEDPITTSHPTEINTLERKSSLQQTTWNIAKMCMGTGTLALPYAADQGGYLFNAIGLAFIMVWNLYSVHCLLQCLPLLPSSDNNKGNTNHRKLVRGKNETNNQREEENHTTREDIKTSIHLSTLEKVTYHAFGRIGVGIIDGISLCLYFGVITAYIGKLLLFFSFLCMHHILTKKAFKHTIPLLSYP